MRMISLVLSAAASVALAAGTAQAQQHWGPTHTTYWNSDSTGKFEPGQFMQKSTDPAAVQPVAQQTKPQKRMFYQAPKRTKAQMRIRQQQPGQPAKPPTDQGAQPPAERGAQPPADAKPSAPPSQGQPNQRQGTPK